MARDYMDLGSAPANAEGGPNVGEPDYHEKGRAECDRFLNLLRKTFGDEPARTRLAVKSNPHDFGSYYSVVVHYDPDDEESSRYAYRCEAEAPTEWDTPAGGDQPAGTRPAGASPTPVAISASPAANVGSSEPWKSC